MKENAMKSGEGNSKPSKGDITHETPHAMNSGNGKTAKINSRSSK